MDIKEKILELLSERYGWTREEVLNAQRFDDLGLDSLSIYSLIEECESIFNISIQPEDITDVDSPESFIKFVEERAKECS